MNETLEEPDALEHEPALMSLARASEFFNAAYKGQAGTLLTLTEKLAWKERKKLPLCRLALDDEKVTLKPPKTPDWVRYKKSTAQIQLHTLKKTAQFVETDLGQEIEVDLDVDQFKYLIAFLVKHTHTIETDDVPPKEYVEWWSQWDYNVLLRASIMLEWCYNLYHNPDLFKAAIGPVEDEYEDFDVEAFFSDDEDALAVFEAEEQ